MGAVLLLYFVLVRCAQHNQFSPTTLTFICAEACKKVLPSGFTFIINKTLFWPWPLLYWILHLLACLKSSVPIHYCSWEEMMDAEISKLNTYHLQSKHHSYFTFYKKIIHELNISEIVLWNLCTISKSSLSRAISNLGACHTRIPQDLWLKLNQAEMAERENHMRSNHYGQELAGFRVLCVLHCYALLYSRQGSSNHTEGGWQSCVIKANRNSDGWPGRAVLAPSRDYRVRVDSRQEELLPSMHGQAPWWMTSLIWVVGSRILESCSASRLQAFVTPTFMLFLFRHVAFASLSTIGHLFDHVGSNFDCTVNFFHVIKSFSILSDVALILCHVSRFQND